MHFEFPWKFIKLTVIQQHQGIHLKGAQLNMSVMPLFFTLLLDLLVKSSQKSLFFKPVQLRKPLFQGSMIHHTCEHCYA